MPEVTEKMEKEKIETEILKFYGEATKGIAIAAAVIFGFGYDKLFMITQPWTPPRVIWIIIEVLLALLAGYFAIRAHRLALDLESKVNLEGKKKHKDKKEKE